MIPTNSKREMNEWASRAITALEYALADMKRFKRESGYRALNAYADFSNQFYEAHKNAHKIYKSYYPDPEPEPQDNGGDRHVRIQRARLLESSSKQLPQDKSNQPQLDVEGQLLFPGVK